MKFRKFAAKKEKLDKLDSPFLYIFLYFLGFEDAELLLSFALAVRMFHKHGERAILKGGLKYMRVSIRRNRVKGVTFNLVEQSCFEKSIDYF